VTKQERERQRRNKDLIRRAKLGENINLYSSAQSFFPSRDKGFIKKDPKALEALYGEAAVKKPKLTVVSNQ
jgi:hypothetical protein